jgi:nucleotide-binding universal stress UspA family protein
VRVAILALCDLCCAHISDVDVRMLHYPCLIVKSLIPAGPRNIIMAVNDTTASKRGFDILIKFVNPRDTLTLVHFTHSLTMDPALARSKSAIQEYYERELQEVGPVNSSFTFSEYEHGVVPAAAVVDYVNNSDADLFAIAPRAGKDRSSITESVVNHVNVSVLLCKN